MNDEVLEGGCLCGQVRYRAQGPVEGVAHCHCGMCRRASGAAALTWFWLPHARFKLTQGTLRIYRSSPRGKRSFCGRCGTPLTFQSLENPAEIDITLGSLDHPERLRAQRHVWTASRLPWLHLDEDLPDFPADGPG